MLYIFIIPLVILAVLFAPVVFCMTKKKGAKSVKKALIGNLCAFGGVMVMCLMMPVGMLASAETVEDTAPAAQTEEAAAPASADGMRYLAAALAVGLGSIGGGVAVAAAAPAAIGAVSEDPKSFSKALIFVALGEGCALYGFIVALLMIFM